MEAPDQRVDELSRYEETRVWLRFAKELLRDGSVDDIVAETFEIARMMGAAMRKRGYSGWASA